MSGGEIGAGLLLTGDFFRTAAGEKPASLHELYTRWQLQF